MTRILRRFFRHSALALVLFAFHLSANSQTSLVLDSAQYEASIAAVQPVPRELFAAAEHRGRAEELTYTTQHNGKTLQKRVQVYVPYGYKATGRRNRLNVVYLMHGGGDNTTSFFADPRSPLPLTNVLDHLIAEHRMDPVLVVCPTFYPDDRNIGANRMEDAIRLTRDFHTELMTDVIPFVERHYNTYLRGASPRDIQVTRQHRAFGGFSMGALCTWFQLAYGVDAVRNYLPLSGDLWVYDANGQRQSSDVAARWLNEQLSHSDYADDFCVYGYTGTDDIAGNPEKALVRSLQSQAPLFRYQVPDANLYFSMKKGGKHYYGDINEYLYYALPLIWR